MSIILRETQRQPGENIQFNREGIFIRVSNLTPRNDVAMAATLS